MSPLSGFRRYAGLSAANRWLYIRAFIHLFVIDIALKVLGYQRVLAKAKLITDPASFSVSQEDCWRARRYARLLEAASRHHFIRARCLHRSLGLHRWLRQEGLPSELRIGVRKERGALRAHAWVELEGYVVYDEPIGLAAFTPLDSTRAPHPAPIVQVRERRSYRSSDTAPSERQ